MGTGQNILIAFILNMAFSVFEFAGGIFTGSVAILSDALHDMGDAASIGISWLLEKKSQKQPDEVYTYGYARFSVLGSVLTTLMLLIGSVAVIYSGIRRIISPTAIHYDRMILFAVVGVCVNFGAAFLTHGGESLNQKAVNLHMLEDVLGWLIVLVGAVIMRFTDIAVIDPVMSVGVAVFILANAVKNLKEAMDLFLEKIPHNISVQTVKEQVSALDGVLDVHHIHLWSLDGQSRYGTMHIVAKEEPSLVKEKVRNELKKLGISHLTLELETEMEQCCEIHCHTEPSCVHSHNHIKTVGNAAHE